MGGEDGEGGKDRQLFLAGAIVGTEKTKKTMKTHESRRVPERRNAAPIRVVDHGKRGGAEVSRAVVRVLHAQHALTDLAPGALEGLTHVALAAGGGGARGGSDGVGFAGGGGLGGDEAVGVRATWEGGKGGRGRG